MTLYSKTTNRIQKPTPVYSNYKTPTKKEKRAGRPLLLFLN